MNPKRGFILATRQILERQAAGILPFSPSDRLLRIIAATGQTRKAGGLGALHPDNDDVVVRQRRGNPHVVYLIGTSTTPDQFSLRTREEAVTQAVAFAKRQHVRAWFDNGDNTYLLLGTFRVEQ